MNTLEERKYPIGKYHAPLNIDSAQRVNWIHQIAVLPEQLSEAVAGWSNEHLGTPYREQGWTVRQVVHHVADSHINSYVRFRWALTEDTPLIKAYDEKLWADLADSALPVEFSLQILRGLHKRWVELLLHMAEDDFSRSLRHPVSGEMSLEWMLGLYAWHGQHHLAHIHSLRRRMNW